MMRERLTFANVASTLALFLVLAGGTAFAATQLAKKSVGTKQLKANAVTTAKIKKAAVTKAKIKDGAVDGAKIADGSVTGAKLSSTVPYGRRIASFQASAPPFGFGPAQQIGSFTQNAEEIVEFLGSLQVSFSASCEIPRSADAYLLLDNANPNDPQESEVVGAALASDASAGGTLTRTFQFGNSPSFFTATSLTATPTASQHTLSILIGEENCKSGSGITVGNVRVDVIGTR